MITFDQDWGETICEKCGTIFNPFSDIVIARVRQDGPLQHIMGGVVYTGYNHESIGIHVASWEPRWINRDMLYTVFGYAFHQLDVKRIFGQIAADNPHALSFDLNLGFREVARVPGVYKGNVDCIVVVMEKNECRFLNIKPSGNLQSYQAA